MELLIEENNTDCSEMVEPFFVEKIFKSDNHEILLERIFLCLNKLYREKLLNSLVMRYSMLNKYLEIKEIANEAFNEGLLEVYKFIKNKSINPDTKIDNLLFRFIKIRFLNLLRLYNKPNHLSLNDHYYDLTEALCADMELFDSEAEKIYSRQEIQVHLAIRELKKEWQPVVYLSWVKGFRSKQIADIMELQPGSVDNILCKAKKFLRTILITKYNFFKEV